MTALRPPGPAAPFARLAEHLPDPVFACNSDGSVLAYNPAAAGLAGTVGLDAPEQLLPARHVEYVHECLYHDETAEVADTRVGPYTLCWTYVPSGGGTAVHVLGRDVTDSRRTEAALRISEARHRLLAEQSTDIISRHSPGTWTFLYASPAAQTLLGYAPEELVGRSSLDFFHPEDRRAYQERGPSVAYERGIYVATYRYRHKDGHYVYLESTSRTLRDPVSGDLLEIISVSREVSRRVLAERATKRLARIVEATTDLVAFFEPNGRVTYLNEAARRVLGIPYPENKCLKLAELMPAAAYAQIEREALPTARLGGVWSGETAFVDAMGREIPVSQVVLAHAGEHDEIDYFSTIARDISERRQAEEREQRHQAEMTHVARLITMGEMASGLAHELNQPLAAIVNYARGAIRRIHGEPPAELPVLAGVLERIAEQASRAGEIIKRLRSFARKSEFRRAPVDLNKVVGDMIRFCRPEARRHALELRAELTGTLPAVLADRVQIEQVLLNLLRNAMEATVQAQGSGHGPSAHDASLRTVTLSSACLPGRVVAVHVADHGHGLPPGGPEPLFEQFYTTKPKGLGLGLSISRSIMEAHGGALWAENRPGGGAVFSLSLPAAP